MVSLESLCRCRAHAMPMCCHLWLLTEVQLFNAGVTWPAQHKHCQIFSPVGQLTRLMCLFQENEVNLTLVPPKLLESPRMCH